MGVVLATVASRGPYRGLPAAVIRTLTRPPVPPAPAAGGVQAGRPDLGALRSAAARRLRLTAARASAAGTNAVFAVIADAGEVAAMRAAGPTIAIRPEDWAVTLEATAPDLLVVTSARDANGGAWAYRIAWTVHPDRLVGRDLDALIGWCSARDIASVFVITPAEVGSLDDWREAWDRFDLVIGPEEALTEVIASHARHGIGVRLAPPTRSAILAALTSAAG